MADADVYKGQPDEFAGNNIFADCLSCGSFSVGKCIDYLYTAGNGKGLSVSGIDIMQTGTAQYPLLILMNGIFGLYGMIWTQLVVELLMLPATSGMYMVTWKKLKTDG